MRQNFYFCCEKVFAPLVEISKVESAHQQTFFHAWIFQQDVDLRANLEVQLGQKGWMFPKTNWDALTAQPDDDDDASDLPLSSRGVA